MSLFEIIGFFAGITGVWLAAKENPWNWPLGIISVGVYAVVFLKSKLYGDMLLQLFYIVIGIYGWYIWLKGAHGLKMKIENCKKEESLFLFFISIAGFFVAVFLLKKTDSNVPYLDGLTTVLSITATWMMARKYIEHWLIWIFVDLVYVFLYSYKSLYLTAVLYFIFTILAVYGFYEWRRIMKLQKA
jgi:nicotinamide mononucleotide transporter